MSPQQTIAHYRVIGKLGEGGMGTVYRATDTKLGREVAIKVLPDIFAQDAGRMTRFTREARVLASLNHPNIAAIYGVEECALVMELVEGLTLAARIAQGPIPIEEALAIAHQMAGALEYAHEKNVVHRDLKPANIKVTPEGRVKVLDFGLAKALAEESAVNDPASSPTMTMRATVVGAIIGTAGYMAPEQARGKQVDKRADIWAFGVVLYEMLTGKLLYAGETVSDTIAGVLTKEPDMTAVPMRVRRLLARCLEKDPKKRLRDMGDYAGFLDDTAPIAVSRTSRSNGLVWLLAGMSAIAALGLEGWTMLRPQPLPPVTRFQIFAPAGSTLPPGNPAPSPDGRRLAYSVREADGVSRLAVRSLDSTESRMLPGTEGALHPFWSPDGKSLAFTSANELRCIDLSGGTPRSLASATGPWHGSWNQFGKILFQGNGVSEVAAEGGAVTQAVKSEATKGERNSGFPFFLPDGKRFLVLMTHQGGSREIDLATLGSNQRKLVLPDTLSAPILALTPNRRSYLLYLRDSSLMAREFDLKTGAVRGNPFLLIDTVGVVANPPLLPALGVSPAGVLAYQTERAEPNTPLELVDRSGKPVKNREVAGGTPALSPDGRTVAVVRRSFTGSDIWLVDLERGSSTRLTFGGNGKNYSRPLWSPDGKRVFYTLQSAGIFAKDASGTGAEERILERGAPLSVSPDGRLLLYGADFQLFLLPLSGAPTPVQVGEAVALSIAQISPDGKYFAFTSAENGGRDVFIEPMPPGAGKWQISTHGGSAPRWRRDGKELFFVSPDGKMMAVDIQTGSGITAGVPHTLFQTTITDMAGTPYDVTGDGQRFLIDPGATGNVDAPITVVLNWWAGLKSK